MVFKSDGVGGVTVVAMVYKVPFILIPPFCYMTGSYFENVYCSRTASHIEA